MIGYATVGTNDLDRARAFYDALLAEIGARRVMEFDENGFTLYGTGRRSPGLAVTKPYDGNGASPGNGAMVALAMDSRGTVDRLHQKAIALGGSDEGAPGLRTPEGERAFYGAYFRDLDGNKLCAFCIGDPKPVSA
jgi:catechol 2,3-dioxygenase-like lactoylglutathione lyase family enzyme